MKDPKILNDTVYARIAPSPIHGLGVFAIRDMPEGTRVTDFYGEGAVRDWLFTMDWETFAEVLPEIRTLVMDRMIFEEGLSMTFVSPNASQLLHAFMNHSDTPNTDGNRTTRLVKKGEELTENYNHLAQSVHPLTKEHMPFL